MPEITITVVRHHGQSLPLGRNVAVKLLLDKSTAKEASDRHGVWSTAREFCVRSFLRTRVADANSLWLS